MDNRFTLKDFIFVVLFVLVGGAVGWTIYQKDYQEQRLNDLKTQLVGIDANQKQQLTVLGEIRNALKGGVSVAGTGTQAAGTQGSGAVEGQGGRQVRRKNPDGSQYVYFPDIPESPRHPEKQPDYATGDWLIQNVGMEPAVLTPFIVKDMSGQMAQGPVLESLVAMNPQTLDFEPALADWYEISADGLRFKFHLRPQVVFSDGVPMTADDVVFSYDTVMNEDVDCAPLRSYYDRVKGCKKIDDRTVEFEMKEPYFLAMEFVGGLTIIPKHIYKFAKGDDFNKMGETLVGSGPYKVEKWDRGQKITFVRSEKYWGDRPTYDKIVYLFIGNAQAQLQSFTNGQLDYLGEPIEPDPEIYLKYSQDAEFLQKFKAYKFTRPTAMYMYVGYNMDKPMFKDKETRQALTMLVDRKAIIDQMLHGFGAEMTGPFVSLAPQNDATIKPLPYDMEGAKKKLAAAGWKPGADGVLERDGVRFEFDISMRTGVPIRERIATYMQQQFQQAGIRMRLTPYESSVLIERIDERKFDASLMGWGGGTVESDPRQIWHSSSFLNRGSNAVGFRNAEADKLIDEGERTVDKEKRLEIWHQFQRIVYDEQPYMFLYSEVDCAFVNGRFRNTDPYPLGLSETDWYVPAALQKYR